MFFDTRKPLLWFFFAATFLVSFGPTLAKVLEKRPLKSAPLLKIESSLEAESESNEKEDFSEPFDIDFIFDVDSYAFEFTQSLTVFETSKGSNKNILLGYFLRAPPIFQ
jgi:hypothetical protein